MTKLTKEQMKILKGGLEDKPVCTSCSSDTECAQGHVCRSSVSCIEVKVCALPYYA